MAARREPQFAGASTMAAVREPQQRQPAGAGAGSVVTSKRALPFAVDLRSFGFYDNILPSKNPRLKLDADIMGKAVSFIKHVAKSAGASWRRVQLLDVGGNSGKDYERKIARVVNYTSLDFAILPTSWTKNVILGNIQRTNHHIADGTFDSVTAFNVFEHIAAPWKAAAEMKRLVRDNGFMVLEAPFAWRYHAYPMHFYGYTHTGLRYLFESEGGVQALYCAYSNLGVTVHGHYRDHSDEPPDANLIKQVGLLCIFQLNRSAKFDPESLDHNEAFKGPMAAGLPDHGQDVH